MSAAEAATHPEPPDFREDAGYAALHMANHMKSVNLDCEDDDTVRHFAAKVRAALAATPDGVSDPETAVPAKAEDAETCANCGSARFPRHRADGRLECATCGHDYERPADALRAVPAEAEEAPNIAAIRARHRPESSASCSCGGRRWVNDENWEGDGRTERTKHDGLIPCGFCNEGGWDTPDFAPDPAKERHEHDWECLICGEPAVQPAAATATAGDPTTLFLEGMERADGYNREAAARPSPVGVAR